MAILLPAVEPGVAEIEVARTVDAVIGRDGARLDAGQCDHHLERGAGCVQPGRRLVDQRRLAVLGPLHPLRLRHAGIEQRRIERRVADHRQHLAVAAVHHHRTGALVTQPVEHLLLQLAVDGQRDVLSLLAFLPVQFADHPPDRVYLQLHRTGAAAQLGVLVFFHPGAADADAGQCQHRVGRDIRVVGRRHVADDMRQQRPERIQSCRTRHRSKCPAGRGRSPPVRPCRPRSKTRAPSAGCSGDGGAARARCARAHGRRAERCGKNCRAWRSRPGSARPSAARASSACCWRPPRRCGRTAARGAGRSAGC